MSLILPPKKDVALALLERASVFIHLDPRQDSVMVPTWLKKQPQLVLQVGLNMAVTIPDLEIGDDAVSCTLSFSRRPQFCSVPWSAIYALVGEDGRGMIWPEDIPAEVAAQADTRAPLRAVESSASDSAGQPTAIPELGPKKRKRTRKPKVAAESAAPAPSSRRPLAAVEGARNKTPVKSDVAPVPGQRSPSERPYLRLVR